MNNEPAPFSNAEGAPGGTSEVTPNVEAPVVAEQAPVEAPADALTEVTPEAEQLLGSIESQQVEQVDQIAEAQPTAPEARESVASAATIIALDETAGRDDWSQDRLDTVRSRLNEAQAAPVPVTVQEQPAVETPHPVAVEAASPIAEVQPVTEVPVIEAPAPAPVAEVQPLAEAQPVAEPTQGEVLAQTIATGREQAEEDRTDAAALAALQAERTREMFGIEQAAVTGNWPQDRLDSAKEDVEERYQSKLKELTPQ